MSKLPTGWKEVFIGDVTHVINGKPIPKQILENDEGEIPFYKPKDLTEAWFEGKKHLGKAVQSLTREMADSQFTKLVEPDSVTFVSKGTSLPRNVRLLTTVPCQLEQNIISLSVKDKEILNPLFLYYFTCGFRMESVDKSTNQPSISCPRVREIPMPLPPPEAQCHIVSKLGKVLPRVDASIQRLLKLSGGDVFDSQSKTLDRLKQSILAKAFQGEL